MANGFDSAITRRLRGLLPQEDIAAIGAAPQPTGPFAGVGTIPGAIGPAMVSSPTGPFADVPEEEQDIAAQQTAALQRGMSQGFDAVARRQAALAAAGGGQFLDPSTGGPAVFGGGRFRSMPAMFMAGGGLDERIREIGEAVKRRLEELTGAPPNQPQFASPQPMRAMGPATLRRGRFGT